jgi:hypothetical protein
MVSRFLVDSHKTTTSHKHHTPGETPNNPPNHANRTTICNRLGNPGEGQRIVLHATDRGCTAPGCDVPGYLTEVHHVRPWATTKTTHIDDLTLACGPHHRLITPGGWSTRKRQDGITEWIPPAHLDHGQPRTNTFHHPEKLLHHRDDNDDDQEPP